MINQIIELCQEYKKKLAQTKKGESSLFAMCETLEKHCLTWPIDKSSRWLGYIQGMLTLKFPSLRFMCADPTRKVLFPFFPKQAKMNNIVMQLCDRYIFKLKNNQIKFSAFPHALSTSNNKTIPSNINILGSQTQKNKFELTGLFYLCLALKNQLNTLTIEQSNRWLGFIQAHLVFHSITTIHAEREFTRPLFHRYYRATKQRIPKSISVVELAQKK